MAALQPGDTGLSPSKEGRRGALASTGDWASGAIMSGSGFCKQYTYLCLCEDTHSL